MTESNILDVCIIGGGFTGLNCALLLGKEDINCEIYTTGYGASNLWMGTFDFLKYDSIYLKESFNEFKKQFPEHPYKWFNFDEINSALSQFFDNFPQIKYFQDQNRMLNKNVLTSIGTLKPCLGIWQSLFYDFDSLNTDSNLILVGFHEFNNSALHLVKKALEENFESNFYLLNLSFNELSTKIEKENKGKGSISTSKLSEFKLGRFFDSNYNNMKIFSDLIKEALKRQISEIPQEAISYYLFPPILGIDRNEEILENLSSSLDTNCHELIALSPSLIANRLMNLYEKKLKNFGIKTNKGKKLIGLDLEKIDRQKFWKLKFEDNKGDVETILSKVVIFSNGTMFQAGMFETIKKMNEGFERIKIDIPNKLDQNFQLTKKEEDGNSNLFVCGAALYNFTEQISDEVEIEFGTGLGLSVISSYKVVNFLINK
jgi:anaerobic glycerol-3-phosphate dehydrogenase